MHLRTHGMTAADYKEVYGIARTASLWPPATAEKQRRAALERGQGDVGRRHIPPSQGRPKGLPQRDSVRIDASEQRRGVYTRGGSKTR